MIIATLLTHVAMVSSLAMAIAETAANPKATRSKPSVQSVPPAPAPPPVPPSPPSSVRSKGIVQHAQPIGSPGDWATTDDYPTSAIRNEEAGTPGFTVTIGVDGRVTQCQIVSSSGSAALDEATCRLVRERAKFQPALDAKGKPVEDRYTNRIKWVLPLDNFPDLEPATRDIELDLDPRGRVEACRVFVNKGYPAKEDVCANIIGMPSPFPLSEAQKAQNKRRTIRVRMQLDIRERN
jgi:TonB family protein